MFTAVLLTYLLLPVVSGLVAWTLTALLRPDGTDGPTPPFLPDLPRTPAPVGPRTLRLAQVRKPSPVTARSRPMTSVRASR